MAGPPEQRLSEALRAQAAGAGGWPTRAPGRPAPRAAPPPSGIRPVPALLVSLLGGVLLGVLLALISLLGPGVLPG